MIDYSFTYQREGFNLTQTHDASLHIRAGKNGISFLIHTNGTLAAWKDFCPANELTADSDLIHILTSPYKDVKLGIVPDASTLIPSAIFDFKDTALYARYLDVKAEDKVLAAAFDDENYLIGKAGGNAIQLISERFDLSKAMPADKGWINSISKNYPTSNQLYVNIDNGLVSIANFKSLRLHFYNSFEAANVNDVLYYALFVAEQIQMQASDITLVVSGNIDHNDEDWNKLSDFTSQVKLADVRPLELPEQVKAQQVLALASLA